jgi:tellurite resistance protein TerC
VPVIHSVASPLMWTVFTVVVTGALALDLFVFHRHAHSVKAREAGMWVLVWIALAAAFGGWIWYAAGHKAGLEFATGYLVEYALSVDNIFVFIVIFRYFKTPAEHRHRVLFWGIVGAVVLRGLFVVAGLGLIALFHWTLYIFGALLLYTGIKLLMQSEMEMHPEENPVVRFLRKRLRMTKHLEGEKFLVRIDGKLFATPLLAVLLVIDVVDVIFAIDSIPAIFGVTQDYFIVFTSNIFAVLGLRSIYFLLAGIMDIFRFLKVGLSLVLIFVGVKMLVPDSVYKMPIEVSLGVIAGILATSVVASLVLPRQLPRDSLPPEERAPTEQPGEEA